MLGREVAAVERGLDDAGGDDVAAGRRLGAVRDGRHGEGGVVQEAVAEGLAHVAEVAEEDGDGAMHELGTIRCTCARVREPTISGLGTERGDSDSRNYSQDHLEFTLSW